MARDRKCGDCGGDFEEGYVPDASYGQWLQMHWHPGTPKEWKFLGIPSGTKVDRRAMIPVETWRCSGCGRLRFYAPE